MRAYGMAVTQGREATITGLYLSGQELDMVPLRIQQMTKLRVLDLSDNHLTDLPAWLPQLEHLHTLILSGNKQLDLGTGSGLPAPLRIL